MEKTWILLVEDQEDIRHFNALLLVEEGYGVHTAGCLAEARVLLAAQRPSLVILDIGLPDGNGLSLLGELRKRGDIPVLILTGYGQGRDIIRGFQAGCDDYLSKPYLFEDLLLRVRLLLG